jgi:structural maintenance of chromosome 3 (chondroitin sulfate proteoglycan 6)
VGGDFPLYHFLTPIPCLEFDEEGQELGSRINTELERLQAMQASDSRGLSKHQKSTERYLAKRELLTSRRDVCNKNIRDLGVLPEEAFEKYTTVKLERVNFVFLSIVYPQNC